LRLPDLKSEANLLANERLTTLVVYLPMDCKSKGRYGYEKVRAMVFAKFIVFIERPDNGSRGN
jgi:hypothetical protein